MKRSRILGTTGLAAIALAAFSFASLAQAAPLFRRVIERAPAIEGIDPDTVASAHSGLAEALSAEAQASSVAPPPWAEA